MKTQRRQQGAGFHFSRRDELLNVEQANVVAAGFGISDRGVGSAKIDSDRKTRHRIKRVAGRAHRIPLSIARCRCAEGRKVRAYPLR